MTHVSSRRGAVFRGAVFRAAGLVGVVSAAAAPRAEAQIQFVGTTTACFFQVGDGACSGADFVDNPSFREASFNGRTGANFGTTNLAGSLSGINFGTLRLGTGPDNCIPGGCPTNDPGYDTRRFRVRLQFTQPGGVEVFATLLDGQFASGNTGQLTFDFDNAFQTVLFSNASGSGSFDIRLNDQTLQIVGSAVTETLTGDIRRAVFVPAVSTVPEPSTWALMGTGLLTLAGVAARRKRSA